MNRTIVRALPSSGTIRFSRRRMAQRGRTRKRIPCIHGYLGRVAARCQAAPVISTSSNTRRRVELRRSMWSRVIMRDGDLGPVETRDELLPRVPPHANTWPRVSMRDDTCIVDQLRWPHCRPCRNVEILWRCVVKPGNAWHCVALRGIA